MNRCDGVEVEEHMGLALQAAVRAVTYSLPEGRLTNEELAGVFPGWSADKIEQKTGIRERRVTGPDECASDLAFRAAQDLFATEACGPADIDFILLCTQSPDYFLPTTACLLQSRLGVPTTARALDFNLGSSDGAAAEGRDDSGACGSLRVPPGESVHARAPAKEGGHSEGAFRDRDG